jgi:hypothetical protein
MFLPLCRFRHLKSSHHAVKMIHVLTECYQLWPLHSIFEWLPKSRNRMTIPIQRSHYRNIIRLSCGFRHLKKQCGCMQCCQLWHLPATRTISLPVTGHIYYIIRACTCFYRAVLHKPDKPSCADGQCARSVVNCGIYRPHVPFFWPVTGHIF